MSETCLHPQYTKELKLNAVEEWRSAYINYSALKKIIYGEEKRQGAKATPSRKSGTSEVTDASK